MSRHRLTVVLSQAPGKHPAKRALEESIIAALILESGLDVSIVPHLYEEDGTLNQEKYDAFVRQMEKLSPIRRVGEPIDQAYLILYLVSDAAKFCTGQIWRANGGQAMA